MENDTREFQLKLSKEVNNSKLVHCKYCSKFHVAHLQLWVETNGKLNTLESAAAAYCPVAEQFVVMNKG